MPAVVALPDVSGGLLPQRGGQDDANAAKVHACFRRFGVGELIGNLDARLVRIEESSLFTASMVFFIFASASRKTSLTAIDILPLFYKNYSPPN